MSDIDSPVPAPLPTAVQPPAPAVDIEALSAKARAAVLAELGVKDPEEAKAAIKAAKEAAEARMSEGEKTAKALKESAAARAAADAENEALRAEIKAQKAANEMRDKLDTAGVAPKARVMVDALYHAEKSAKGKDFDESAFFESTRKDHPSLFGSTPVAPATTSPAPVAGAAGPPVIPLADAAAKRPWMAHFRN